MRQRQLLGDTVLRRAIQHAMRQLQLDDGPIGQHMRGSRRAIDRAATWANNYTPRSGRSWDRPDGT